MAEELRGIARRRGAASAARTATNFVFWGGLTLLTSGAAQAQVIETPVGAGPETKSISVRVGAYLPSDATVRKYGGKSVPAFQVDYKLQIVPFQNSVGSIGVGYIERDNLRIIPIVLNQTWREPGRTFFGQGYYYGAGAGLYSIRLDAPDTSNKSKLLFGLNVHGGLDFNNTLFGDVTYQYVFKYDSKSVSGFIISLGARL